MEHLRPNIATWNGHYLVVAELVDVGFAESCSPNRYFKCCLCNSNLKIFFRILVHSPTKAGKTYSCLKMVVSCLSIDILSFVPLILLFSLHLDEKITLFRYIWDTCIGVLYGNISVTSEIIVIFRAWQAVRWVFAKWRVIIIMCRRLDTTVQKCLPRSKTFFLVIGIWINDTFWGIHSQS